MHTTNESIDPTTEGTDKDTEEKTPKRGKKSPASRSTKLPQCSLPANMQPTFYIGGGNGVSLVEAPLLALGWKRTLDKYDEKFRLKWVECKTRINYGGFKEGDQMVNHIPNGQLLTNKLGLLNSLQEYERVTLSTKGRPPRLKFCDFFPETYRLDEKSNKDIFLDVYKDGELWICKPTGLNQGKGIFIIRSRDEINKLLEEREQKKEQMSRTTKPMMTRIVQRYIMNPLLLTGRKFDIRAYMLIASTVPFLVLYHKGYVRLCYAKYDTNDHNLSTHLTNQYVQKKEPNFKDIKEDTIWSMEKFNDYFNEKVAAKAGVETDWVLNQLPKQMQKIMIHCFNSVKHKLNQRIGYFDLFGLDFMVDSDLKVWLIEINVNPSLSIPCTAQRDVIPGVVEESLYLSIECFEKSRKNQSLLPLNTLKNFSVLYCGTRPNTLPPRTTRSVSPVKEDKVKVTSPNSTAAPRTRQSIDQGRGHRVPISSTPLTSTGIKKAEDTSSNAATKSVENSLKVMTSDQPQSETESVPLKMTHVSSSDANGAKVGSEDEPKVWALGTNGVLTLQGPNPVTQTVATTQNLDQIKSILAQIGTPSSTDTGEKSINDINVSSQSSENVPLSGSVPNSNETLATSTAVNDTVATTSTTKTVTAPELKTEKSSLHRSAFPSLISTSGENVKPNSVTLGLTTPKSAIAVSSSNGGSTSTNTSQSTPAPRSVPITTFSMSNVTGLSSAQHERDRAETMAAYTTLSKLNSSNLPSISQTNSVVKPMSSSGNQNMRLSNIYKTTTTNENAPSLKFTSLGQNKQNPTTETQIEVVPHRRQMRDYSERGS